MEKSWVAQQFLWMELLSKLYVDILKTYGRHCLILRTEGVIPTLYMNKFSHKNIMGSHMPWSHNHDVVKMRFKLISEPILLTSTPTKHQKALKVLWATTVKRGEMRCKAMIRRLWSGCRGAECKMYVCSYLGAYLDASQIPTFLCFSPINRWTFLLFTWQINAFW